MAPNSTRQMDTAAAEQAMDEILAKEGFEAAADAPMGAATKKSPTKRAREVREQPFVDAQAKSPTVPLEDDEPSSKEGARSQS